MKRFLLTAVAVLTACTTSEAGIFGRCRGNSAGYSAYSAPTYYTTGQGSCYAPPQYAPQAAPQYEQPVQYGAAPAPVQGGDRYGLLGWVNAIRARHGRHPVAYDANAEAWAAQNNATQRARGMGHWVRTLGRRQNSGWGGQQQVMQQWEASPAHLDAILDPSAATMGVACDGTYWTMNLN